MQHTQIHSTSFYLKVFDRELYRCHSEAVIMHEITRLITTYLLLGFYVTKVRCDFEACPVVEGLGVHLNKSRRVF